MSRYGDLRLGAITGVLWTGGGQIFRNVMSLVTSVVLARLLTPDDFGVFALSVLAVEFAQLFATAGFGASIVQRQNVDALALSTLYWINIVVAVLSALLLGIAAVPISHWFGQSQLAPVLVLASLSIVISGAMVVPIALLTVDLRFRDLTIAQTTGSLSGAIGAIGLALSGAGVWALAAQPVIGSTVTMLVVVRRSGWLPRLQYQWASVRSMMRFSGQLLASNFFGFLNRSAWAAIIGRTLGTQQVGLFNLGQQVVFAPIAQFSMVVMRVLFPTLAKLNDEPAQLRAVWLRAVGTVAFLTFPLLAGLQAALPDFVPVILGAQWYDVIPVLQVLCVVAMVQSVCTLAGSVLLSGGHGNAMVRISIASLAVMIGCLLLGQRWGLMGVTWGFAIGSLFTQLLQLSMALRRAAISLRSLAGALAPTVGCTLVPFLLILGMRALAPTMPPGLRLALCIVLGFSSYLAASWFCNREPINFMLRALRGASLRSPLPSTSPKT